MTDKTTANISRNQLATSYKKAVLDIAVHYAFSLTRITKLQELLYEEDDKGKYYLKVDSPVVIQKLVAIQDAYITALQNARSEVEQKLDEFWLSDNLDSSKKYTFSLDRGEEFAWDYLRSLSAWHASKDARVIDEAEAEVRTLLQESPVCAHCLQPIPSNDPVLSAEISVTSLHSSQDTSSFAQRIKAKLGVK